MGSFFKQLTSFAAKALKPNSDVSSIRLVMLIVVPLEVVACYALIFLGVPISQTQLSLILTVFCVTAAMTFGPVFLEHVVDKIGAIIKTIKSSKT